MSNVPQHTDDEHEHGVVESYVTGFILSLILTLVPYLLVVNKTFTSNTLLVIILGFAFMQMLIQITFFLHLGRGPKPRWNMFFFVSTAIIILFVVIGSIVIIDNLHYNMAPSDQVKKLINDEGIYQVGGTLTGACQDQGANHQIVIKGGQVIPQHTYANRCDTLTFISGDGQALQISFGSYPASKAYAGENNLSVRREQNQTITLSEAGIYKFYEKSAPVTAGDFTVSQ